MREYSVTKRLNVVISTTVDASSWDEAIDKAEKKFRDKFKSHISYDDGQEKIIGITDMGLLNTELE